MRGLARRWTPWLTTAGLLLVLAVWSTWPLVTRIDRCLPQGVERSAAVPLLNLWTMAWNVGAIDRDGRSRWNAPIYWPTPDMLAASEPQVLTGWLAWPLWRLCDRPARVYNLLVLLHLWLNGWITCRLLIAWRVRRPAARLGGAMATLLPLVHWQLGVAQLLTLWTVPLCWLSCERLARRPGWVHALLTGLSLACCYLMCSYYGLMVCMLLVAGGPILLWRRDQLARRGCWALVALLVALLAVWPVIAVQLRFARAHPVQYPRQWIETLSLVPADYLRAPGHLSVPQPVRSAAAHRFSWPASPGIVKWAAMVIGLLAGFRRRRYRRVTAAVAAMLVLAVLLSLGPHLQLGRWQPYATLAAWVPGWNHLRNLFRFAFLVQLCVVLLAAIACHAGLAYAAAAAWRAGWPRTTRRAVAVGLWGVLASVLVCETVPARGRWFELPADPAAQGWVRYLADPAHQVGAIAHLPAETRRTAAARQHCAEQMYYQLWHGRPLVGGYSAVVPRNSRRWERRLVRRPPAPDLINELARAGVTHFVVDRVAMPAIDHSAWRAVGLVRVWVQQPDQQFEIWKLPDPS